MVDPRLSAVARAVSLEMAADLLIEQTAAVRLRILLQSAPLAERTARLAMLAALDVEPSPAATTDAASLAAAPDEPAAAERIAEAILLLCQPEAFDSLLAWIQTTLGAEPAGRLQAAWRGLSTALHSVIAVRDEWVAADPRCVAYGADLLVDYLARILNALALVASATDDPIVTDMARRYAYRYLRTPAPEAVSAAHIQRTHAILAQGVPTLAFGASQMTVAG